MQRAKDGAFHPANFRIGRDAGIDLAMARGIAEEEPPESKVPGVLIQCQRGINGCMVVPLASVIDIDSPANA